MKTIAKPEILAELISRLRGLRADSQRLWGGMSLSQMLCHLADAQENVLSAQMVVAPPSFKGSFLRIFALYVPIPMPKGIVGRPAPQSLPEDWEVHRDRTIASLEKLAVAPAETLAAGHPMFGKLSKADWQRWAYLHCDHHLRQFGQ